ncbi:hypothetical protein M9Y10_016317 [Tritrichomonas musculus]|uniref:Uncharacterized protein n=1 Tax=Tritrichomonas musculus TaxID=1915356 RepID=A0ABR2HVX5_9EUKA
MLSPVTPSHNPFVIPNFDDSYSESNEAVDDDPEIFYNDIQQSLNDESKYKMNNRKKFIMQSQERSKMRLSSIYQERLQKLAKVQEQQILDLREEWNKARCRAYLDDVSMEFQCQQTTQILSLCGKYSEASQVQQSLQKGKNSDKCTKKYLKLLSIMQNRHQCEIDALVSSFQSEIKLSQSEHEVLNEQIENQYKTDIIRNTTEMINIISNSDRPEPMKQKLIRTVSPQKGKRLSPRVKVVNSAFTPIPKYQFRNDFK